MAPFDKAPLKMVSLEKVVDLSGEAPQGAIFNWTYKSEMLESNALARARAALKASKPDENPMNWKMVTSEQAPDGSPATETVST